MTARTTPLTPDNRHSLRRSGRQRAAPRPVASASRPSNSTVFTAVAKRRSAGRRGETKRRVAPSNRSQDRSAICKSVCLRIAANRSDGRAEQEIRVWVSNNGTRSRPTSAHEMDAERIPVPDRRSLAAAMASGRSDKTGCTVAGERRFVGRRDLNFYLRPFLRGRKYECRFFYLVGNKGLRS